MWTVLGYGFRRACSDKTRENGFKLNEGSFKLDIKKKIFTQRMVTHLNMLLREIVDATFPSVQRQVG